MKRWQNRRFSELVSHVTETRDALARQSDLSPRNTIVNEKLTELVHYVTLPHNQAAARRALQVLSESGVTADLRALCQRAEFQLELFYSHPDRVLDFPYIDHYLKLALKESELANLNANSRVVFVGGGPLPWTPLVLTIVQAARAQGMLGELTRCLVEGDHHADAQLKRVIHREFWRDWPSAFQILSVEKEPEAAAQAVKALTKLGMQDHVQVTQVDGAQLVVPPGFDTFFIANPSLASEQSDQFSVGVVYDPVDWLDLSLDYYNITVEDTISQIGAQDIINSDNDPGTYGPIPAGMEIVRLPNGRITEITAGYANAGDLETDGIDFRANTDFDFGGAGRLQNRLTVSWVNKYDVTTPQGVLIEYSGLLGYPDLRANLANDWAFGDWNFTWNINYIAGQESSATSQVGGYATNDVQVAWSAPWNGKIAIGATNVGDRYPELVPFDGRPWNFYLYDAYGRTVYLRYTQTF